LIYERVRAAATGEKCVLGTDSSQSSVMGFFLAIIIVLGLDRLGLCK